jgi:hypothetical protein
MENVTPENCYNFAIQYLKNKYGYRKTQHTEKFSLRLRRARNKKEFNEVLASITDDDWLTIHNPATDDDGHEIELLLQQYSYGRSVRYELYNKLCCIGAIVE